MDFPCNQREWVFATHDSSLWYPVCLKAAANLRQYHRAEQEEQDDEKKKSPLKNWATLFVADTDRMIPRKCSEWLFNEYDRGEKGVEWILMPNSSHEGLITGGGPIRNP